MQECTLEPGIECCIDCDSTEQLKQCQKCNFLFCETHFTFSDNGVCSKCIEFISTKHPKCWNCSKTVPKEQLHPTSGNSTFAWRCYGFTYDCEECIYWRNREPKCPNCKQKTLRSIRRKVGDEYIEYKKPRFWCPTCKKNYKLKEPLSYQAQFDWSYQSKLLQ